MSVMNHKEYEDRQLLSLIQQGDEKAFDRLFMKYYPGLMRYCSVLLPYPSDEAEDIVLEVFFKLWQQRKTLVIYSSLVSFLYIALKNRCHDYYRKKNITVYEPDADEVMPHYLIPDQQLVFKELKAEIEHLITQLPARTQLVFRMNREDHLTYEDIAIILNISINSVKTHMYRSIKFLKETYRASDTSN